MNRRNPDDASADLALARTYGLKGFVNDDPAHQAENTRGKPDSNVNPSTKSKQTSYHTKETAADLELARRFGLNGFV